MTYMRICSSHVRKWCRFESPAENFEGKYQTNMSANFWGLGLPCWFHARPVDASRPTFFTNAVFTNGSNTRCKSPTICCYDSLKIKRLSLNSPLRFTRKFSSRYRLTRVFLGSSSNIYFFVTATKLCSLSTQIYLKSIRWSWWNRTKFVNALRECRSACIKMGPLPDFIHAGMITTFPISVL